MRFGMREFVFLLLLLAMPLASYFFVFEPRNAQIEEAREEIRQKQLKLRQLEEATKTIADLGEEIDKLTEAIELFERKLPNQREVEVILEQVWELAAAQRLMPKSVRTDKPIRRASYTELPIRMLIFGNFDGFYSFLLELEKLPRITQLPMMRIRKFESPEGELQAELVLSIFFDATTSGPVASGQGSRP